MPVTLEGFFYCTTVLLITAVKYAVPYQRTNVAAATGTPITAIGLKVNFDTIRICAAVIAGCVTLPYGAEHACTAASWQSHVCISLKLFPPGQLAGGVAGGV
jgi:hypothetical protein